MSSREQVQKVIFEALENLNHERADGEQIEIGPATPLFGVDAVLNSLELVSVMVDVETLTADDLGRTISVTDDRALQRDIVPFTNVATLTDYILELLSE